MSLTVGSRLGPYEIVAPLGAGGMGEVYRGRDLRLNRDVAIKVLPDSFATDPDRLARFQREAQVLASLSHPNIGHLYGIEDTPSTDSTQGATTHALVLELIAGPTLADRMAQGPLPLAEALAIARQIADALEAAHERGVVHRDLKPANIKVTDAGTVKVLDFGLAKALDHTMASGTDAMNSPTFMSPAHVRRGFGEAGTQMGVILGTAAYMAPEQAKGKAVDKRADIWAFGVVLFEMLTGQPLFAGDTMSETLAAVIKDEPALERLPAGTPSVVRRLLARCLERDPKLRLRDIGEARIALEHAGQDSDPNLTLADPVPTGGAVAARQSRRREWMWASLALVSLLAAVAIAVRDRFAPAPERATVRFEIITPERGGFEYPQGSVSLSPDGRKVAFVALSGSKPLLWVHSFDSATAQPLEGTEGIGPAIVMWSPDSRHIAFSAQDRLRRIAATGGPSQVICSLPGGTTGTWGTTDVILLGGRRGGLLQRVSAAGGEVVAAVNLETSRDESHRFPYFLPDGRHYFYLASRKGDEPSIVYIGELDSNDRRPLPGITSEVKYSSSGHVLFLRDGSLMAQAFDVNRLELSGEPFLVADRFTLPMAAAGAFSVSANGTLAYRSTSVGSDSQLTWFDRAGKPVGVAGPAGSYNDFEVTANDRFVVFEATRDTGSRTIGERTGDIWVLDLESGVTSRVTSHPAREADPVWSPDGKTIVFRSDRDGGHLYERAFGVVAEDKLLFKGETRESPDHWSPDGQYVIFSSEGNVWALPLTADRQALPIATTPFAEREGRVSPDGRWIAYVSDEPGQNEIYLQSFPKASLKQQVSTSGGSMPRWSHDGQQLHYLSRESMLMAVAVRPKGESVSVSAPVPLFHARVNRGEGSYAVSPTGRFLVNVAATERTTVPITVILNWAAGLGR